MIYKRPVGMSEKIGGVCIPVCFRVEFVLQFTVTVSP